jgi:hypothetical protein
MKRMALLVIPICTLAGSISLAVGYDLKPLKAGQSVPEFAALFSDGNPLDPKVLQEKVVVYIFHALDDRRSEPLTKALIAVRKRWLDDNRLQMISVCTAAEWEPWMAYLDKLPPYDPANPARAAFSDRRWWQAIHYPAAEGQGLPFKLKSTPCVVLVGRDGRIISADVAADKLEAEVVRAFASR